MSDALIDILFDVLIHSIVELHFQIRGTTRTEQRRNQTGNLDVFQEELFHVIHHAKEDVVDLLGLKFEVSRHLLTIVIDHSVESSESLRTNESDSIRESD